MTVSEAKNDLITSLQALVKAHAEEAARILTNVLVFNIPPTVVGRWSIARQISAAQSELNKAKEFQSKLDEL